MTADKGIQWRLESLPFSNKPTTRHVINQQPLSAAPREAGTIGREHSRRPGPGDSNRAQRHNNEHLSIAASGAPRDFHNVTAARKHTNELSRQERPTVTSGSTAASICLAIYWAQMKTQRGRRRKQLAPMNTRPPTMRTTLLDLA